MKIAVAVTLMLLMCGCVSYVTPADRAVIHDQYLNARDINDRVHGDESLPDYARAWWAAEAEAWRAIDAWSHGKAASPAGEQE